MGRRDWFNRAASAAAPARLNQSRHTCCCIYFSKTVSLPATIQVTDRLKSVSPIILISEETTDAPSNQYLWRRLHDYHVSSTALRRRLRPARQTRGAMGGQGSIAARRARDKPGHQERWRCLHGRNAWHASGHGDTTQRLQD